jgi:hypothetical protein
MSSAIAKRVVEGWSVTMDGDEPRILDEELGTRLRFARPAGTRDLIKRLIRDQKLKDIRCVRAVRRQSTGQGGAREFVVNEYWLTDRR